MDQNLPEGLISIKEARECQKRYLKKKHKPLCHKIGFEDEMQFTFSLERIKQYIEYIEKHAEEEGYEDLGLKICLGAYEKKGKEKGPKSTLFFVPTAKNCSLKKKNKEAKYDADEDSSEDVENENIYTMRAMNMAGSGGGGDY